MSQIIVSSGTQPQAGMPQIGTPMVDENGMLSGPWGRFFIELWKRTGGSGVSSQNGAYFVVGADGNIGVYATNNNTLLGTLVFAPVSPLAPQAQTLGASPFKFTAAQPGTLVVSSGAVSITRSGVTASAGSAGGALALAEDDSASVSWTGGAPSVVFFPLSIT